MAGREKGIDVGDTRGKGEEKQNQWHKIKQGGNRREEVWTEGKKREVKCIKYAGRGMTKPVKARGKKEGKAKCKNVQKKEISRKETGREKRKRINHIKGGAASLLTVKVAPKQVS